MNDEQESDGFDVTVERVIGRVEFDSTGKLSPFQAAMMLIARDAEPGRYRFAHRDGGMVTVVIEID